MNKKIIFITIMGALLFWATPVFAQNLVVDFGTTSLFNEANFLPGQSVTRCVNVTNNSGETKKIGLEIIDNLLCSTDCLSDKLDLVVSQSTTILSGSLTTFYGAGEQILSDLNTGDTTTYCFSMTFNPDAGNTYKNSSADFNIKIGFFGEESISQEVGGGGGHFFVEGLEISNEDFLNIETNSVTIIWDTNKNSTSRVIYSPENIPHTLQVNDPPNYGYVFSTDEDPGKTMDHSMFITGLLSGTTYYYRCISHASPDTVSQEHTFTTMAEGEVKGESTEKDEETSVGGVLPEGEVAGATIEIDEESDKEKISIEQDIEDEEEISSNLFASVANLFRDLAQTCAKWWIYFILIIINILIWLFLSEKKRSKLFLVIGIIMPLILFIIWLFVLCMSLLFVIITETIYLIILILFQQAENRKRKKQALNA